MRTKESLSIPPVRPLTRKLSLQIRFPLLRKSDHRKVICAAIAKGSTTVGNDWLAERLAMGHGSYVSTLAQRMRRDRKEEKALKRYEKMQKI